MTDIAPQSQELMFLEQERQLIHPRLGKTWRRLAESEDGEAWETGGLRVIYSIAVELDGYCWLHVSASRPDRLPSYSDMKRVKSLFIGDTRTAYSVWAPTSKHVSIHAHALHLWCPLNAIIEPLPDFTRGGRSI
jgi:hypothetical protein